LTSSAITDLVLNRTTMNVQRWITRREPDWKRLDGLLQQAEKQGIKSLSAKEIKDLASL